MKHLLKTMLGVPLEEQRPDWYKTAKRTHILILLLTLVVLGMGVVFGIVYKQFQTQRYSFSNHIQNVTTLTQDSSLCSTYYGLPNESILETSNEVNLRLRVVNFLNPYDTSDSFSDSLVLEGVNKLNGFFEKDTKFKFILDALDIENVRDEFAYYNMELLKKIDGEYKRPGFITIYTFDNTVIPTYNGAVYTIPSTALSIKRGFFNKTTLAHEMGHVLGLLHTFESDNTSHGLTPHSGDRVCDTPINWGLVGAVSSDCDFIPGVKPILSVEAFEVLKENLLSYSYYDCRSKFTKGQAERMYFMVENSNNLRECVL